MLSHKYIKKIQRMNEQLGPPEDSFSPDWHQKHPRPLEGAVLQGPTDDTRTKARTVLVQLEYRKTPEGDEVIAHTDEPVS